MRRLRRFAQLSRADRTIFLRAVFLLVFVRFALHCLSLRRVLQFLNRLLDRWKDMPAAAQRIAWATKAAARCVPGSTCLTQALALHALLIRHGYQPLLTIGVTKNDRHRLDGHAWVSCDNRLLIGGPCVERYNPVLNLASAP
jgi:transglutaminase superfamily protein